MTRGKIIKQMLIFGWPILLGLLLQQLYNTVDAVVVGNYVGSNALAAVGTISGSLVNVIISFAIGLFAGANVLVSQFYGAGEHNKVHNVVHMELLLSIILGVALAAVGYAFTPALLGLINTPAEVIPDATTYLRIYFLGLPALFVYNAGASILTALGDSIRPLIYLIITTVLNIVGDLVFVLVFDWDTAGVACATVIAEVISVLMVLWTMRRAQGGHRLIFKDLRLHPEMLKKAAAIGIPGGLQGTIVSLSNFAVQSYLNGLGATTMAGYSASSRIDAFAQMPLQAIALVLATFVGQNLGAQQVERARKGVKYGVLLSIFITMGLSALALVFARPMLWFFSPQAGVVEAGLRFMYMITPFYFLLTGVNVLPGALRGAGDVRFATISCILSFVVVRQIYLFTISQINYNISMVAVCYPATWLIAGIAIAIHYKHSDWTKFEKES
ncbi:MAG: MATE family efflux transporter [Clostridiales bacterium]|nr:MATE family efflux transporter [Clostridiales bacterium]